MIIPRASFFFPRDKIMTSAFSDNTGHSLPGNERNPSLVQNTLIIPHTVDPTTVNRENDFDTHGCTRQVD